MSIQKALNGKERLSIIAHGDTTAWADARSLCAFLGEWNSLDAQESTFQEVLTIASPLVADGGPIKSPPLKIEPLILSGPSNNRVDLVFLSDGCTCFYPLMSGKVYLLNFQTSPKKRPSSSVMPTDLHKIFQQIRLLILFNLC